mmetsp:Transcript_1335/g.1959  ORF Transcript_1335/g.1959 Transcript_1335/m.1959 type:complete len:93 (-) Transcript_1335:1681-1959(-)
MSTLSSEAIYGVCCDDIENHNPIQPASTNTYIKEKKNAMLFCDILSTPMFKQISVLSKLIYGAALFLKLVEVVEILTFDIFIIVDPVRSWEL